MSYIITCMAPKPTIEMPMLAEQLQARFQAEAKWLSHERVFEMAVAEVTEQIRDTLEEVVEDMPLDIAIQPAEDRKKKLIICDMDSTIIEQECIDELADAAGVRGEVSEITARAMRGEIAFEAALKARVALLKGLPESMLQKVWEEQITFTDGAKELIATMKANDAHCALVSGGFTFFTGKVAEALGFDAPYANELITENGVLTGEVAEPILGKDSKVATLAQLMHSQRLSPRLVITVGDGANDIPMLCAAGLGIALHGKPKVREAADICIDYGDLRNLLYLQGYSDDEIVK